MAAVAEGADAQHQRQRGPQRHVGVRAGGEAARQERVGNLSTRGRRLHCSRAGGGPASSDYCCTPGGAPKSLASTKQLKYRNLHVPVRSRLTLYGNSSGHGPTGPGRRHTRAQHAGGIANPVASGLHWAPWAAHTPPVTCNPRTAADTVHVAVTPAAPRKDSALRSGSHTVGIMMAAASSM